MASGKRDPNQMTFFEHLEELRGRILKSLILFAIVFFVVFFVLAQTGYLMKFLAAPLIELSETPYVFAATDPKEPFLANLRASFWVSIIFSSGLIFYHVWAFVAPGLTRSEKFFAIPFMVFMTAFFMVGCYFSFTVVFPMALEYLLSWNDNGLPAYTRSSYLSLLFAFVLGMGASFQMPMVIFFLARIGLVTPRFLIAKFRYAVLIIFIVAAIITPTPDFYTQTVLAVPMLLLYLAGVGAAALVVRKKKKEELAPLEDD
ncbi:MAG: twin-arginine translocase subunit TatC [Acidobacteria bacterium]|nr:twin-arginine translocase subunit TatC [Acidobacteriota bacterium]